jgi:two-component system, sensor histidine kinase and response regulator
MNKANRPSIEPPGHFPAAFGIRRARATAMHPDSPSLPSGATGAIDARVIQGLRDLGGDDEPELLSELIDIFLEDAPQRMKDITEGLAGGDLGRVERGAHTLKSSSANIGALGLSDLCRRIVECARTNHPETLPALCEASVQSLADAATQLRSLQS